MTIRYRLHLRSARQVLLATTCLAMAGGAAAWAGPSGLSVGSGQVTVSNPNPQTTVIQQSTNKAVLNWNSFSIGSNETVQFQQPSASSIAVNRVTGGQASSILGSLVANGQVWLVNPNGIIFGRGATVNLAGLIATTSDIRDSDFLAGNYNFGIASPNPNAGIVNQGTIQAATGGSVVLSGAYVRNDGLIQANLGKVVVGGATAFAVSFSGDSLLSYAVTGSVTQAPVDQNGNPVTALVSNTGSIIADGGQVTLTARAAKNILDNVINTTGIVEANTASMVNGTVVFDASDGGVTVGGTVSATGLNSGETGGTVKVLGGAVTVASGATISASGDAGGGSVYVGGDFHGAGPDPDALTTDVQQGATIRADAITFGNGGNVAVWADGLTAFNGTISARGGALGGNGGFVETSGKQGLSVQTGTVNTLAPHGQVGNWLLDPLNIVVQTGGSTTAITSDPFANNSSGTDTLDPSAISGAASDVTLQATQDVTFNNGVAMTNSGVGLTVQAGRNISFASGAGIITTGGSVTLSANDNGASTATGSGGISLTDLGISTTGKVAAAASLTAGSTNITVVNSAGFNVGQTISGAGIPSGTTISSISGNTLTLSNAATVTASDVAVRQIGGSTSTGGAISLTTNGGSGAIDLGSAGLITAGGAITLNAASITSNTNATGISSAGNNASGASTAAGGNVSITTTTGGVTLGGGIVTSGGFSSTNVGGNSGSVTISSAGAVDIGGGLSLVTSGSGSALASSVQSISTNAASPSNTSQTTGNGGNISVTGASINLELGATSNGGTDEVSGSTSGGGNAGSITLNATNGDVLIGSDSTGSVTGLIARGGDSLNGAGGAGANISVTATAISVGGKILSRGGDTVNGTSVGAGGNITLTATGSDLGHSIRLYGTSDSPTDTDGTTIQADVSSRGGQIGQTGGEFTLTGTVTGPGGNITFQGANGGALQSDVLLQTSSASSLNGGSTVSIGAGGGSTGGTVLINGAINAASSNVESLRLTAGNGSATVNGGIGTNTALNSVVFGTGINDLPAGSTSGAMTLNGPVTAATQIQDLRGSGSLTFNGLITTPLLKVPDTSSVSLAMNGGAVFSGDIDTGSGNTMRIAGTFQFTSSFTGTLSGDNPPSFILNGPAGFDTSALNKSLVANSISGNNFPLTVSTGSGNLTVASASGVKFVLRGSGIYTITNGSGVSFDFSGLSNSATAYLNGTKVFPLPSLNSVLPPPPPMAPPLPTPPSVQVSPTPITLPIAPAPNVAPGGTLAAPPTSASANAPQTVEDTDTGGSMFNQISSPGSGSASSGMSSGSSSTTSASTSGSDSSGNSSPGSSSDSSSSSGSTTANGAARGSGDAAASSASTAPSASSSNTPAPPPSDSSDRALSVIASPPPVQPVSHALPAPPRVTTTVVPGYVSQVQHPPVPKQGTPGIQQNYSASGNSGRW